MIRVMKARIAALVCLVVLAALIVPSVALAKPGGFHGVGAVYVLTNDVTNAVAVFARDARGRLMPAGMFPTGGAGTGAGLGSQGALARSANGKWLFAVNAGSNELSVFSVGKHGSLTWADKVSSMGTMPVSVTVHDGWVYVLNDGGTGNIAGFRVNKMGHLAFVAGSIQPLSNLGVGTPPVAEQIGFKPDGTTLVVTEKSTNMIDLYGVTGGVAGAPMVFTSNGAGPYGFDFTKTGKLIVSEAAVNALSSYWLSPTMLSVISPSVTDAGIAPCWVAVSTNSRFAYTSDAHSNDVSIYSITPGGRLAVLTSPAVTVQTPLDLDTAHNGRFLYVLAAGSHTVDGFRIREHGSLHGFGSFGTLPASASGLVAW